METREEELRDIDRRLDLLICIKIKQEIKKPEKGIPQGNPERREGNMYTVQVNGKMYEAETDKKPDALLLRDDLHLTPSKTDVDQGACGTVQFWWTERQLSTLTSR